MLYAENFSNVSFSVECTNSIQFLKFFWAPVTLKFSERNSISIYYFLN